MYKVDVLFILIKYPPLKKWLTSELLIFGDINH